MVGALTSNMVVKIKGNIHWVDAFSRTGAHVLCGMIVGILGLGLAAFDIPVGKEAMATGFTWAARSMWGSKDD
jgi:hypothetical protein